MIFALLFILAFLLGLVVYLVSKRWVAAVVVPSVAYLVVIVFDAGIGANSVLSLVFGLPITFCGGLLGAYVVELRRGLDDESSLLAEGSLSAEGASIQEAEGSKSADGSKSAEGSKSADGSAKSYDQKGE